MITDLFAEGYQSLRSEIRLRLGLLTVVTGPTGSGKSSIFRAVRLTAFNARGTGYISQGASKAIAGLGSQPEGWAATITRGGRGSDSYKVAVLQPVPDGGEKFPMAREYTKLGGKVPDEVAELVNLGEINFASQFDRPFLLCETAGDVARILGQLTHVTLIFSAAREAQRRKKGLAADLKLIQAEVARLRGEIQRFATLQQRAEAAQAAEEALVRLTQHEAQALLLQGHLERLGHAQHTLELASVLPPEPPHLGELAERVTCMTRLQLLLDEHQSATMNLARAHDEKAKAAIAIASAEQEHHKLLHEAGICPTCQQKVPV